MTRRQLSVDDAEPDRQGDTRGTGWKNEKKQNRRGRKEKKLDLKG